MSWLGALALACVAVSEDSGTPSAEVPDVSWEAPPIAPVYGIAELEELVGASVEESLVHPAVLTRWLLDTGDVLRSEGQGVCPGAVEESSTQPGVLVDSWFGDCETEGYWINGGWLATYALGDDARTDADVQILLSLVGTVGDEGEVHHGGIVVGNWMSSEGNFVFDYEVAGDFRDASAEGPLGRGVGLQLTASGGWSPQGGLRASFAGSIASDSLPLRLDEVTVDVMCGPGASGTLWARDPSTGWWTIEMAEDCTGCGPASFAGVEMGEACGGVGLAAGLTDSFAAEWP